MGSPSADRVGCNHAGLSLSFGVRNECVIRKPRRQVGADFRDGKKKPPDDCSSGGRCQFERDVFCQLLAFTSATEQSHPFPRHSAKGQ